MNKVYVRKSSGRIPNSSSNSQTQYIESLEEINSVSHKQIGNSDSSGSLAHVKKGTEEWISKQFMHLFTYEHGNYKQRETVKRKR